MIRPLIWFFALLTLALLPAAFGVPGRISATLQITNVPVSGRTLVVNSQTRTWSTVSGATTILTNLAGTAQSATNLFEALSSAKLAGPLNLDWEDASTIRLTAQSGNALSITTNSWALITYSTQAVDNMLAIRVPIAGEFTAAARTNIASLAILGFSDFSTNKFATNAIALENYVTKGTAQTFGNKVITNSYVSGLIASNATLSASESTLSNSVFRTGSVLEATNISGYLSYLTNGIWFAGRIDGAAVSNLTHLSGILGALTNGFLLDVIAENLTVTNLSSPGPLLNSQQFGGGLVTENATNGLVIGTGAIVAGRNGISIGTFALASGSNAVAAGSSSEIEGADGVGVGNRTFVSASAPRGTAIGTLAGVNAGHTNSGAFGFSASTTKADQLMMGRKEHTITVPGTIEAWRIASVQFVGSITNAARWSDTASSFTTLGNGNNIAVDFGSNSYVRLDGTLTGDAAIVGIVAGINGTRLLVENNTGHTITFAVGENDPTPGNRFATQSGTSVSMAHAAFAQLIYDSTESRWNIVDIYPQAAAGTNATLTLTADNTTVSTTNRAYLKLTSDNVTAGNRTFVLTPGSSTGQTLKIHFTGAFAAELVDDSVGAVSGNHRLSATWTAGQYDSLSLTWDGTDWIEDARSAN